MTKSNSPDRPGPGLGRRELMELLGASVALAGLGACTQSPREKIFPHAQRVPELTPGQPLHYATSMLLDGFAMGLLARSNDGRPTKIEGNPEHPASLGATGVYEQASVLDLYDPKRSRAVRERGAPSSWPSALSVLERPSSFRPWIVLPPQSSPLVAQLLEETRGRFPACRVCFHAPLDRLSVYRAARSVFGRALDAQFDFRRARRTLSLGADFLSSMPMSVRWARDFSAAHRQAAPGGEMSRLYVVEPMLTPTGSLADQRLAVPAREIPRVAAAILAELAASGPPGAISERLLRELPRAADSPHQRFIAAVARDLRQSGAETVVIAGDQTGAETQVLAHALNAVLGSLGGTVSFSAPALIEPEGGATLEELVRAIDAKEVDAVVILDSNPVYTGDPALALGRRLGEVSETLHLTYVEDETSRVCRRVLPLAHYLESWGDARAYDGTLSFVQPLIEPLYPAKSVIELLGACAGRGETSGHRLLTDRYRRELGARFEAAWPEHLKLGFIADSAAAREPARPDFDDAATWIGAALQARDARTPELHFQPSPQLYDGRFASNAWLLELPHPVTKQAWGNAAVISPVTAAQLGVGTGRVIQLEARGQRAEAPVVILPGHADGSITLELGYGQTGAALGRGVGTNAYPLKTPGSSHQPDVLVRVTEREERLAITQDHADARDRALALIATRAEYRDHPDHTRELRTAPVSLLPMYDPAKRPAPVQWAMTIDTTLCTGCSSCVVACQAENNVPVVGKADVERGREMHWLRIDRYFSGPAERPHVVNQPMLCQHCEKAPCEYVCPTNATVHSPDGLNEMVYNRCIGTRFCSNNCPYKVRRFNWFEYSADTSTPSLQRNPDVTVRDRGVMEKCTYCVQRIRRAEIQARIERREIAPGEVVTACQQACPTEAIQFGALEHRETKMAQWREEPRAYFALNDLGTRPRTKYLTRIVNPNPELDE